MSISVQKIRSLCFGRRVRKTVSILGVTALMGSGTGVWLMADKMVTPRRIPIQEWQQRILDRPAEYGIKLDPFTVNASDDIELQAILVTPHDEPGTSKKRFGMENRLRASGFGTENQGLVMIMHGRSGMKENALPMAERFVAAGFTCVLYDARAHGQSGGRYCTFGKQEVGDALAILESSRIRANLDEEGPVYCMGYSLGAAVLMQTLAQTDKIDAAATIAPFCDLEELVVYSGGKYSAGHLPHFLAKCVVRLGEFRGGFHAHETNPLVAAENNTVPTFVIHGSLDRVIPVEQGRRVFAAIPHKNKRWQEFEFAYHGNIFLEGGDDLYQEIIEFFLTSTLGEKGFSARLAGS